jgi:hypothetical protein
VETVKSQKKALEKQGEVIQTQEKVIVETEQQLEREKDSASKSMIFGISSSTLLLLLLIL